MITSSQLLLTIIVGFIILRTFFALKKKSLSIWFSYLWIGFWCGVLVLIFQQDLVSVIAHRAGISRGVDLIIYLSLIVVFYLIYRIFISMQEADLKITLLVRKNAIKEAQKR